MKSRKKARLLFKADAVITLEPLDADAEKVVDKLLEDITVSKSKVPCG